MSKGFIWYYNFIMKIRFNPKQRNEQNEIIFLLDEPGSYLHDTAQEDLCKKIGDIYKNEGAVIYCTHSSTLLLPEIIPYNQIQIVDKTEKNGSVSIDIESVSTKNTVNSVKNTSMQPIYEALQKPEYEMIYKNEKIVCVEGIYDKYAIESFCDIEDNIRIFPSVGAMSIINNIQYFIGFRKSYIALWDNDEEGITAFEKAKMFFGELESKKFGLLPNCKKIIKFRMEEMISQKDKAMIKKMLKLPLSTKYESMILNFYQSNKDIKNEIRNSLDEETKTNFGILQKMINSHFSS